MIMKLFLLKFIFYQRSQQMTKPNSPHKKSQRYPLFCLLFLGSAITIILHLIFLYSAQDLTVPKPQYLNRIFKKLPYSKIADKLQQNQYGILQTDCKQCANQLIQHIGYQLSKPIFVRDYTELEGVNEIAKPLLWSITLLIRNYIVEPQPKPKIWVLHTKANQLTTDIEQIKALQPRSTIFVVVPLKSNIKYKGFKKLGKLQKFDAQQILESVKIPKQLAQVYSNYHNHSVPHLFNSITKRSKATQEYLGKYYVPLEPLSKKGYRVLMQLCKNGKIKQNILIDEKLIKKLSKYGLKITRGLAYWKDDRYRLNLMLQNKTNCVKIEPPFELIEADEIEKQEVKQQPKQNAETQQKCQCKPSNILGNEDYAKNQGNNKKQQSAKSKGAVRGEEQNQNQQEINEAINDQQTQQQQQPYQQTLQKKEEQQGDDIQEDEQQIGDKKAHDIHNQGEVKDKEDDQNQNEDQDQDEDEDEKDNQNTDEQKNLQTANQIQQEQQRQNQKQLEEQQEDKDEKQDAKKQQGNQQEQHQGEKPKQIDEIMAKIDKIHQQQL